MDGVTISSLTTYPDERGFFREVVRYDDLGIVPKQTSHAYRGTGVANGWHIHRNHGELFYVVQGVLRLALKDCRTGFSVRVSYPYTNDTNLSVIFGVSDTPDEYLEVILGEFEPRAVYVPAGVAHAYKVLSGDCHIVYSATATYETSRLDEGRVEYNHWPEHEWWRGIDIR